MGGVVAIVLIITLAYLFYKLQVLKRSTTRNFESSMAEEMNEIQGERTSANISRSPRGIFYDNEPIGTNGPAEPNLDSHLLGGRVAGQ